MNPELESKEAMERVRKYMNLDPEVRECIAQIKALENDLEKVNTSIVKKLITTEIKKKKMELSKIEEKIKFNTKVEEMLNRPLGWSF